MRSAGRPDRDALRRMPLVDRLPRARLRVPETLVARTAVDAIDVRDHLGRRLIDGDRPDSPWAGRRPQRARRSHGRLGTTTVVDLDGTWGDEVSADVERHEGRSAPCCRPDWERVVEPGGAGSSRRRERQTRRPTRGRRRCRW